LLLRRGQRSGGLQTRVSGRNPFLLSGANHRIGEVVPVCNTLADKQAIVARYQFAAGSVLQFHL
jgi:hypothetical protein